jgi:hypothetical protein
MTQQSESAVQVAELLVGVPAPIMYWEQGHEWLFGDPVRFQVSPLNLSVVLRSAARPADFYHANNKLGDMIEK